MTVYWFMMAWVILFGIMAQVTAKRVCVGEYLGEDVYEPRANLFMALVTFAVIIFFAGARSYVADTTAYIKMFKDYPLFQNINDTIFGESVREPGFKLFSILVKTYISDNYTVWLSIIATISGICVMFPLYEYSCNFGVSAFLFMASCQFCWMFNGMRQFLAASIAFCCTGLILKNRILQYIVIICLLGTIHRSAFILIPIYFIVKGEPWSKRTLIFVIAIIVAVLFASKFTELFNDAMDQIENGGYSINESKATDDGTNIIRILVESIPLILAFTYRNKIKNKLTPIIKLSINMSLITSGVYIISKITKSSIIIGRVPIYFSMYNLILLPWLLKNIFEDREKNLVYYIMILCYFAFFYYQMIIAWGGMEYYSQILNLKY